MTDEITFIHAADLHLDSPFKGLAHIDEAIFQEIKESTFSSLNRLTTKAIEKQVDFVLLTGDLFDNEKQSLKAQVALRNAFERLNKANIAVYLSYGNHDFITGNEHQVTYPDNVVIFLDEKVRTFIYEKAGVPLASISGFSYVNRQVVENKTADYTTAGLDAPFHIAMLHGSIQGNTDHDTYAPFLLSELTSKQFDYWALGHIHKQVILNEHPYVVYSGNTQGRHRNETGKKGCYFVQMSQTGTKLEFLPLQQIEFTTMKLDVSNCVDLFQSENLLLEQLQTIANETAQLIDLTLLSQNNNLLEWQTTGQLEELQEIINEKIAGNRPWQYIFRQTVEVETKMTNEKAYYGEHFLGELQRRFAEADSEPYLRELYHHQQARKYLTPPTADENKAHLQLARTRLMNKLLKGEAE